MIMGMDEEVTPYAQINQEEIDKMGAAAVALRKILEKKVVLGHQLENEARRGQLLSSVRAVELAHAEEPPAAYSNAAAIYLNPRNTRETRSHVAQIRVAFEGGRP